MLSVLYAGAVVLFLLELGTAALIELGAISAPRPRYGQDAFWRANDPRFGVWHAPSARGTHTTACFDVEYRTNSVGARDAERSRSAEAARVVVLGDSFVEGWGLPLEDRLSDRLEAATGTEHLNFGMAHFGPYQEYLVYRDLAREFDHDAVLVGVLPGNDFANIDFDLARTLPRHDYRYRPYLVGDPPELEHVDFRENALRRFLRHHSYVFNALLVALDRFGGDGRSGLRIENPNAATRRAPSWFYDYSERQVRLLEEILGRLADATDGATLAVVLIPLKEDMRRHRLSGADPLSERLRAWARDRGEGDDVRIVNLLPAMAAKTADWRSYFFECDYHWNAFGNRVASETLLEKLGDDFYGFDDGRR